MNNLEHLVGMQVLEQKFISVPIWQLHASFDGISNDGQFNNIWRCFLTALHGQTNASLCTGSVGEGFLGAQLLGWESLTNTFWGNPSIIQLVFVNHKCANDDF